MAVLDSANATAVKRCADVGLQQQVTNRLATGNFPALQRLTIDVDRGILTLSGLVRSFHEKQVALCLSRQVAGIAELVDRIEVSQAFRDPAGASPDVGSDRYFPGRSGS
jgi:osmotically-inducible protein OsmY